MLRRFVTFGVLVGAFLCAAPAGAAPTTPLPECIGDPATNASCVGEPLSVDGITFSKEALRAASDRRPTRPRNVTAERVSPTKGKIRFDPARPRGSTIRRYKAYCRDTPENSNFWAWASDDESPLVVRGLQPGFRYECTVRARSRAGFGPAARVTLRANPN